MQLLSTRILINFVKNSVKNNYRFLSTTNIMAAKQIAVGDNIPKVEVYEDSPANKIDLSDFCSNKKVIIFGVPGAFTPGCSKTHLPGYIGQADKIKSDLDVNEIVCVSVNDPFVMSAWGKQHDATGKVRMFADPHAKFAQTAGLTIDLPPLGGIRSKRYSMLVENCVIKELNVEPDGTGLGCSLADKIGKK